MRELAPDVWQLGGFPPNAINVYLIGDVLIDAATRWAGGRILRQLGDRKLSMLALTHVHPDHQGCARMICERYAIPLACPAGDVPTMQGERPMQPDNRFMRTFSPALVGTGIPRHPCLAGGRRGGGVPCGSRTGSYAGARHPVP